MMRFLIYGLLLATVLSSPVFAQDWTRFRGPNGSGISDATTVPVDWTESDYNWKTKLPGAGASSPVVWGDKLFVTSGDLDVGKRFVTCLKTSDGSTLWQKEFPLSKYRKHKNNSFASHTPAVDADHVYVLFQGAESSPLTAFDHAGKEVWKIDLGAYKHGQGGGVSPIAYQDMVIISNDHKTDSFLLAVDRRTGKTRWKIDREGKRACYSTPCIFQPKGRPTEIIFTHSFEGIIGVDAQTGKQNWHIDPFGRFPQRAVGSPVIAGDLVVGSSGFVTSTKKVVVVRPEPNDKTKVSEVYRVSKMAPHVPSPLVYKDRLYLWADNGIVSCHKLAGGENVWTKRVGGNFFSSPICVNGRLYNIDRDGNVPVIAASDQYQLLARNKLSEGSRATPAVSGGVMYVRTDSHVFSLGGKK